jgi:hypothetical protein
MIIMNFSRNTRTVAFHCTFVVTFLSYALFTIMDGRSRVVPIFSNVLHLIII